MNISTTQSSLVISETFYSIQGEGPTCGTPAVFLRLAGCNLNCPGFSYKDPDTQEHLGCDTALVWRQGKRQSASEIIEHWKEENWIRALDNGAHLVITGGEPTLQQEKLLHFIEALDRTTKRPTYIEMETNATRLLDPQLLQRLQQINASPKLSHAGEPESKTYQPEVLKQLVECDRVIFKFVMANPSDINEVKQRFMDRFGIAPQRIWLMPEGGTPEAIQSKAPWIVELCKRYYFHYSPRLHIDIWGETTGV